MPYEEQSDSLVSFFSTHLSTLRSIAGSTYTNLSGGIFPSLPGMWEDPTAQQEQ